MEKMKAHCAADERKFLDSRSKALQESAVLPCDLNGRHAGTQGRGEFRS